MNQEKDIKDLDPQLADMYEEQLGKALEQDIQKSIVQNEQK